MQNLMCPRKLGNRESYKKLLRVTLENLAQTEGGCFAGYYEKLQDTFDGMQMMSLIEDGGNDFCCPEYTYMF